MTDETLRFELRDGIAVVTVNRAIATRRMAPLAVSRPLM
jgi:hypothetical protein